MTLMVTIVTAHRVAPAESDRTGDDAARSCCGENRRIEGDGNLCAKTIASPDVSLAATLGASVPPVVMV